MKRHQSGCLLVRAGTECVGLVLADVVGVVQLGEVRPVPVMEPAVRGLVAMHGRMVPLIHLASLLQGVAHPSATGNVGVVMEVGGKRVCLEVEDAEILLREPALPVPAGEALPWALGVARHGAALVPILDLAALSSRLLEATSL
jgi:chemotaxis signal transduction protein